jgi:hypothetical protein
VEVLEKTCINIHGRDESMVVEGVAYWRVGQLPFVASALADDPCSTMFEQPPVDATVLRDVFVKYGGSACHCYLLARSGAEQWAWEARLKKEITGLHDTSSYEAVLNGSIDHLDPRIPLQVFTIIRDEDGLPSLSIVSPYVGGRIYDDALGKNASQFWTFFNMFMSVPAARSSAGWLWQSHVKHTFCEGKRQALRPAVLQSNPAPAPTTNKGNRFKRPRLSTHYFDVNISIQSNVTHGTIDDLARKLHRLASGHTLLIPGASNQATSDLCLHSPGHMTLFQATVAPDHDIKASGLDFLWDAVAQATRESAITGLKLPSAENKWRIVFVVPSHVRDKWAVPQKIDFGGKKPKRQWEKYLEQYVLVLPADEGK